MIAELPEDLRFALLAAQHGRRVLDHIRSVFPMMRRYISVVNSIRSTRTVRSVRRHYCLLDKASAFAVSPKSREARQAENGAGRPMGAGAAGGGSGGGRFPVDLEPGVDRRHRLIDDGVAHAVLGGDGLHQ